MSTIKADTVQNTSGGPVTLTDQVATKFWVNFNGTGTIAARDSFNLSSLTDHGTGQFTLNFSNAFANANYAGAGMAGADGTTYTNSRSVFVNRTSPTTTAFRIEDDQSSNGENMDDPQVHVLVIGDLA